MAVKLKLSDFGVGHLIHAALTDIFQVLRGWEQRCQVFNISGLSNDPNLKDPEDSQHRHTDGDSEEAKLNPIERLSFTVIYALEDGVKVRVYPLDEKGRATGRLHVQREGDVRDPRGRRGGNHQQGRVPHDALPPAPHGPGFGGREAALHRAPEGLLGGGASMTRSTLSSKRVLCG